MKTRTRNLKRLLSLALCLCMVTGLLPVTALAANAAPAITTATLAEATVGEAYTAQLTAKASDQNGQLDWEAEGLPNRLTLSGSGETATLLGTPIEAGTFTVTVTVTETIPAAEPEEPAAQEAGPDGVTEPAGESQPTVLTASRTYTLTVAEAVNEPISEPINEPINEPVNEPVSNDLLTTGDTDGGSTRGSENTCSIAVYNDYLTTPGGGIGYPPEAGITEFAMGDTIFILASNFDPAFSALGYDAFQLVSLGLRPAADSSGYGTIVWTSENGGSAAGNEDTNKLSSYGLPLTGSLSDGEYRFVLYIWNGLPFSDGGGGAETVYVSSNPITIGESAGTGGSSDHPTILTKTLDTAYVGESYSQTLQASPAKGGTLSWAVTAGSLPGGLSLSSTGTISGAPAAAGTTPFTVTVTEKDSVTQEVLGTAAQSFTMEVVERLKITTQSLPSAARGAYYSYTLEANLEGVLWSKLSESPDWLTLYSDGRLSGDCPEDAEDSYTITAVARVGTQNVEKKFTISVNDLFTFTARSIAPAAAGKTCYLKAEQGSNTVTLWSGPCRETLSIPVSSRYSETQVSDVRLVTSLYPSGEVELASHTGTVTLTEGETAALTPDSNSIVKLPEIQHGYGKNVTAYYKNEKGYSLYGGDLAVGNETYTLAAKVSASSGDFSRQYATGRPNFTVGATEKTFMTPPPIREKSG